MAVSEKTKALLRQYADRYETEDFVAGDPSRFMHWVKNNGGSAENIEATAFVASCLSFGSISQFVPKIRSLLDFAQGDMDAWIRGGAFERDVKEISSCRFYRFVTFTDLKLFLRAYRRIMQEHGTLGAHVESSCDGTGLGAVKALCAAFATSGSHHLVPTDAKSACKRLCMFLRWMVRADSPVDLGLWRFVDRRKLVMPLDTHVLDEAVRLGLASARQASMAAALRLTATMAEVFPDDPLKGDFALFGHGLHADEDDSGIGRALV